VSATLFRIAFVAAALSGGCITNGYGQDSTSLNRITHRTDSVNQRAQQSLSRFSRVADSIQNISRFDRLSDSIKIVQWADSMRLKINGKYNNEAQRFQHKMDSMRSLGLPTSKLQAKLDRVKKKQDDLLGEANQKQQALHGKVNKRYDDWQASVRSKLKLDSLKLSLPAAKLPGNSLPAGKMGMNTQIPGMPATPNPGTLPRLNTNDFTSLKLSKDFRKIGGNLSVPKTPQLQQWENTIPAVRELQSLKAQGKTYREALKSPDLAADKFMSNIDAVKSVQKEIPGMSQLTNNQALQVAKSMQTTEGMKTEGIKLATDHFAGHEKELQQAMTDMSKYKKKYESLPNLDVAKRRFFSLRNGLKGARFAERFFMGFNTGFRASKDTIVVDFYPNVSYRISKRIEAGFGGIYRVRTITKPSLSIDQQTPASWGFAGFTVVKTFKNVLMRFEADANSYALAPRPDGTVDHVWRWTFLSGLQTGFPIYKRLTGNVQMLYSFDHKLKDSFPDRIVARIGVQWRFR
jgi:hypothetical protein